MDSSKTLDASVGHPAKRAATPVAGAIAGILFAMLFSISVVIIVNTMSDLSGDTGDWLKTGADEIAFAIGLMPFAGIFFLWFIAVVRERLGRFEDQFFSTVFIGSGLLFLAMVFVAAATSGAIVETYARDPAGFSTSTYLFARYTVMQVFTVYALRMAAVFLISQGTLWVRTGVMPRWMAIITYAVALVLLFIVTPSSWVLLVFPAWVLLVSTYILVGHFRSAPTATKP